MDDKVKQKQSQLTELLSSFCSDRLNEEYKNQAIAIVDKMAKKQTVPFKRGRLDIWASGIIYAIAQDNFLFDPSSNYHISADDICDYFKTKKSTVSKKAALIDDLVGVSSSFRLEDDFESLIYFNKGLKEYHSGDFVKAFGLFNMSLKLNPNDCEALYYKALSLGMLGDFDEALEVIDEAIKINSNEDRFWNDKANFLLCVGRVSEAEKCFDRAIELNPTDYILWSNKGFFFCENDEFEKALECYDKAYKLNPNEVHTNVCKAKVYLDLNDLDNAKKFLKRASKIDDSDYEYLKTMAFLKIDQKRYSEAIVYLDKCLDEDNMDPSIWLFKSLAYRHLNNELKADMCLSKAVNIDPFILDFDD